MLVLTRRKGEVICVGSSIGIVVVDVDGDQVRLGIAAPDEMPITRPELTERAKAGIVARARGEDGRADQGVVPH